MIHTLWLADSRYALKLRAVFFAITSVVFQIDACKMILSANQMAIERVPVNHIATSKYYFENLPYGTLIGNASDTHILSKFCSKVHFIACLNKNEFRKIPFE